MPTEVELLEQKLVTETDAGSRVSLLLELADKIKRNAPQEALRLALEAKTLIESAQEKTCLGLCLFEIASAEFLLSDYESAMKNCKISLELFQKENKRADEAEALNLSAMLNHRISNSQEALNQFLQALSVLKETGDISKQSKILSNIGALYLRQGEFIDATTFLYEGLTLARKANDKYQESIIFNNLASVYVNIGDYPKALQYQMDSLKIKEELNDIEDQSNGYENLGLIYLEMGDTATALNFYFKGLALAESRSDKHATGFLLEHIANVYDKEGNISNALKYFKDSLSIRTEISDHDGRARALLGIGLIHEKISDLENAQSVLSISNRIAREFQIKDVYYETDLLLIRTQLDFDLGRDTKALSEVINYAERVDDKNLLKEAHDLLSKIFTQSENKTEGAKHDKLARYYKKQIYSAEQVEKFRTLAIQVEIDAALKEVDGLIDESLLRKAVEKNASKFGDPEPGSVLPRHDEPDMVINTFGEFELYLCGKPLTKENWQRKKARDLFKYLLIYHGKSIPVDELCEQLWNKMPVEKAIPNLNTTVSALRKALEPALEAHKLSAFLKVSDKTYKLELGENAFIDYIEFKNQIVLARNSKTAEEKTRFYESAALLYTGEFLRENISDEWTFFERESLKEQYIESQLFLSQFAAHSKNFGASLIYAKNILPVDRTFEKAYHLIFDALKESGQKSELKKIYAECCKAFQKELAIDPPKSLRDMMK